MFLIYDFANGKRIRQATVEEYSQYTRELSRKSKDRQLSGEIAGGMTRVGAAEKAAIEQLGVRVIDASEAGWGIINHDLFLSNAEVQQVIRRSIDGTTA